MTTLAKMSFIQYVPDVNVWKSQGRDNPSRQFYPIQKGKGVDSNIQVITPVEGVLKRAKARLKSRIKTSNSVKRIQSKTKAQRTNNYKKKNKSRSSQKGKGKSKIKKKTTNKKGKKRKTVK